jgi:hypothetical protein
MARFEAMREAVRQWFSGVTYVPPALRPGFEEWRSSAEEARALDWEKGNYSVKWSVKTGHVSDRSGLWGWVGTP